MNCPNCDYDIENMKTCPNCGIDPVLFIKTGNVSNQLYNKGLQEIKNLDLSGAVDSLTKSLDFNKNNYVARNLLGLTYYEIGRIGDALRHWIISAGIMKVNNPAKDYIDDLQQNPRMLEKCSDAVKMYNQALNYIALKNDDMAVIQLKKAIEFSPKFIDALNLLSFCYLIQKDKEKALTMIERALAIDANNQISLHYYHEIFPSKTRPEPVQRVKRATQPAYVPLAPKDKKSFGDTFHLTEIITFILGGLCTAAVMYILIMPAGIEAKNAEIESLLAEKNTIEQTYRKNLENKDETIAILESENERVVLENSGLQEQLTIQEKIQTLNKAASLRTSDQDEAAAILHAIDTAGLPGDMVELYNSLKDEIYPKLAQQLYNTGVQRYNARNYEEAKASLEKCLLYVAEDASYTASAIYYLGLTAEANSDIIAAKRYYEAVINEYPNSNQVRNATNRLNALS